MATAVQTMPGGPASRLDKPYTMAPSRRSTASSASTQTRSNQIASIEEFLGKLTPEMYARMSPEQQMGVAHLASAMYSPMREPEDEFLGNLKASREGIRALIQDSYAPNSSGNSIQYAADRSYQTKCRLEHIRHAIGLHNLRKPGKEYKGDDACLTNFGVYSAKRANDERMELESQGKWEFPTMVGCSSAWRCEQTGRELFESIDKREAELEAQGLLVDPILKFIHWAAREEISSQFKHGQKGAYGASFVAKDRDFGRYLGDDIRHLNGESATHPDQDLFRDKDGKPYCNEEGAIERMSTQYLPNVMGLASEYHRHTGTDSFKLTSLCHADTSTGFFKDLIDMRYKKPLEKNHEDFKAWGQKWMAYEKTKDSDTGSMLLTERNRLGSERQRLVTEREHLKSQVKFYNTTAHDVLFTVETDANEELSLVENESGNLFDFEFHPGREYQLAQWAEDFRRDHPGVDPDEPSEFAPIKSDCSTATANVSASTATSALSSDATASA